MGNNVRYYREYHGLSQRQLAARVGVTNTAISAIERGAHIPSVLLALRIARALGVSVEILWGDDAGGQEAGKT